MCALATNSNAKLNSNAFRRVSNATDRMTVSMDRTKLVAVCTDLSLKRKYARIWEDICCLAKPSVVEPPVPQLQVRPGETITITCRAVGVPVPYINWRLNWGPVCPPPRCTQTSQNGHGTLKITDARYLLIIS